MKNQITCMTQEIRDFHFRPPSTAFSIIINSKQMIVGSNWIRHEENGKNSRDYQFFTYLRDGYQLNEVTKKCSYGAIQLYQFMAIVIPACTINHLQKTTKIIRNKFLGGYVYIQFIRNTNNVKIIDTYKAYMISCDKIWPR